MTVDTARGHELDAGRSSLYLLPHRAAQGVRPIGLAPEKPAVTAGHGDGPARGYHSWTAEDPQLHGAADLDRQAVCGADVPYGCDAGTQVDGCVVGAAQNRQGARLTFDRLVGLGGSVPHQMHVRIYQTWHERYVAEVHRLRVGGEPACRAHRGDAAIFDDDRAVFDHPFRGSVENANCTIGYRHVTPLSTLSLLELGTGRLLYRGDRDQGRYGRGYQVEGRREGVTGQGDQVRCEERRRPPEDGDRDVVAYRETAVAYAGRRAARNRRTTPPEAASALRGRRGRQEAGSGPSPPAG